MPDDGPQTVFCVFRVAPGSEQPLLDLCREHDAVLRRLSLCTAKPAQLMVGDDGHGQAFVFKIFEWKSEAALDAARRHPEVQKIWEAMEPLCKATAGGASMEFPHVVPVEL